MIFLIFFVLLIKWRYLEVAKKGSWEGTETVTEIYTLTFFCIGKVILL